MSVTPAELEEIMAEARRVYADSLPPEMKTKKGEREYVAAYLHEVLETRKALDLDDEVEEEGPTDLDAEKFERVSAALICVASEALKAHAKHGENSFLADGVTFERVLSIATEEVGEVAKVINDFELDQISGAEYLEKLHEEAAQAAACFLALVARTLVAE